MNLVSFNIFRTLGLPNTTYLKPEAFSANPEAYAAVLRGADWVLFPEYWQLNGLLYGLGCRIFPSEACYRVGHDKVEMTRTLKLVVPQHLPDTEIAANTPHDAERIWSDWVCPFVAKLPKASQGEGVWLIETRAQWQQYLARTDVLYVQQWLPIDRDLRIVLVGEEVITAYWRVQSRHGFLTNVARGGEVCFDPVPELALRLVRELASQLGINHAGFDIAMVGDHPYLLEFNRLFGNQGIPGGGKVLTDAMHGYLLTHLTRQDAIGSPTPTMPEAV